MSQGKNPGSPHLTLTVKSTSGSFSDEFNKNNPGRKILEEAIHRLHLDPNPAVAYVMKRESDGRQINPDEKLAAQGLEDGDVILIQTSQAQDG
jgi:hypothetical protein